MVVLVVVLVVLAVLVTVDIVVVTKIPRNLIRYHCYKHTHFVRLSFCFFVCSFVHTLFLFTVFQISFKDVFKGILKDVSRIVLNLFQGSFKGHNVKCYLVPAIRDRCFVISSKKFEGN